MRKLLLACGLLTAIPFAPHSAEARTCVQDRYGRIVCGRAIRPYYPPRYYGYYDYRPRGYYYARPGTVVGGGPAVGCPPGKIRVMDGSNGQCYWR